MESDGSQSLHHSLLMGLVKLVLLDLDQSSSALRFSLEALPPRPQIRIQGPAARSLLILTHRPVGLDFAK